MIVRNDIYEFRFLDKTSLMRSFRNAFHQVDGFIIGKCQPKAIFTEHHLESRKRNPFIAVNKSMVFS